MSKVLAKQMSVFCQRKIHLYFVSFEYKSHLIFFTLNYIYKFSALK
jgi:hypothetical protein